MLCTLVRPKFFAKSLFLFITYSNSKSYSFRFPSMLDTQLTIIRFRKIPKDQSDSFAQEIFIKQLLSGRHCSRYWRYILSWCFHLRAESLSYVSDCGLKTSTLPSGQITNISSSRHKYLLSLCRRHSTCTHRDEFNSFLGKFINKE